MVAYVESQKPLTSRKLRAPKHTFQAKIRPFQLQPVAFAPVLAGESLKNALFQIRAISDPVKSKVTGAHFETYIFYCKLSDLANGADFRTMMVTENYNSAALLTAGAETDMYRGAQRIDYQGQCLNAIVRAYFRDDTEAATDFTIDGLPAVSLGTRHWVDSLHPMSELPAETGADDWEKKYTIWQGMSKFKFTTMTFEEWLATSGVSTPDKIVQTEDDFKIPELIRYSKDFVYPVATVNTTDSSVSSMWQWTLADRADKSRFFTEPGFLVALVCVRPKVYRKNLKTAGINLLNTAERWLPAVFDTDPHTSIFRFEDEVTDPYTPVTGATADYYIDMKDLFLHGDQFINFANSDTDKAIVNLPTADGTNPNYPSLTDSQSLFVSASSTVQHVILDGAIDFKIATRLSETTS